MFRRHTAKSVFRIKLKVGVLFSEDPSLDPEANTGLTNQGSYYCIGLFFTGRQSFKH